MIRVSTLRVRKRISIQKLIFNSFLDQQEMQTSDIVLRVPIGREECANWLLTQTPDTIADVLYGCGILFGTAVVQPDIKQIQYEHATEIDKIQTDHSIEKLLLETKLLSERDYYRDQLISGCSMAVINGNDTVDMIALSDSIRSYHTNKKRLPKTAEDIMNLLSFENQASLRIDRSHFDVALKQVRHENYSTGHRKRTKLAIKEDISTTHVDT